MGRRRLRGHVAAFVDTGSLRRALGRFLDAGVGGRGSPGRGTNTLQGNRVVVRDNIAPLRQGNGRWGKELLGYSTRSTIGSEGCTITCLAMLLDTTPDVVNDRLKAVNGFDGQRVVWGQIGAAFPGVTVRHVPSYDSSAVERSCPCVVEVDGAPIGAVRHWVVYLGDGQILDPWFGSEGSLSRYTPLSYAVVKR